MTNQDVDIAMLKRRIIALEADSKGTAKTLSDVRDVIPALASIAARIAEVERDTQQRLAKLERDMAAISNVKRTGRCS